MSIKFLNGYSYPTFKIYLISNGELIDTISLSLTNSSGLTESYEIIKKFHELFNNTIEERIKGLRFRWSLPYDEYTSLENGTKIDQIVKYFCAKNSTSEHLYRIVLIPRNDLPTRNYEVLLEDGFEFGIMKGGIKAKGNKKPILKMMSKYLIPDLQWVDTGKIVYTGTYIHQRTGFIEL